MGERDAGRQHACMEGMGARDAGRQHACMEGMGARDAGRQHACMEGMGARDAGPQHACMEGTSSVAAGPQVARPLYFRPPTERFVFAHAPRAGPGVPASAAPSLAGAAFAIWTTTPWTIPANLAVAVNGDLTYAVVELEVRGGSESVHTCVFLGGKGCVFVLISMPM